MQYNKHEKEPESPLNRPVQLHIKTIDKTLKKPKVYYGFIP